MHNLIRYYFQNKYKIWGVIAFIVLIFLIIQMLNYFSAYTNQKKQNQANANNSVSTIINNPNTNSYLTSDKSAVSGENISKEKLEQASEVIEQFVSACNNGNIEQAYSLITDECKEEFYPTIDKFKTLYYQAKFNGEKKNVSIENWMLNTYKINISEDIMSTGNIDRMTNEDYITIVKDKEGSKINVNNFIKKEEVNKIETVENIKFIVLSKKVFMDYEEFEIQVENRTDGKILLDSKQSTKTIYLKDENGARYNSYSHEIINSLLELNRGFSTQLSIKFFKSYSIDRITNSIIFSDVRLNYDENISEESNIKEIKIDL